MFSYKRRIDTVKIFTSIIIIVMTIDYIVFMIYRGRYLNGQETHLDSNHMIMLVGFCITKTWGILAQSAVLVLFIDSLIFFSQMCKNGTNTKSAIYTFYSKLILRWMTLIFILSYVSIILRKILQLVKVLVNREASEAISTILDYQRLI